MEVPGVQAEPGAGRRTAGGWIFSRELKSPKGRRGLSPGERLPSASEAAELREGRAACPSSEKGTGAS